MGLFKSNDDDNSSKHRFFGGKKKEKPAPNPYAQSPRIDPFTKAKIEAGVAPLPENYAGSNSSPASQSPHNIPSDNKYSANGNYSNPGGYGSKRFDGPSAGSGSRHGGYGGLGSSDPNDPETDADRNELFGNSRKHPSNSESNPPPYSEGLNGDGPVGQAYGGGSNDYSMATFQERQLTAEEEEEQDIKATKEEMRFVKQGDVSSTRNALRAAAQAEETGRATLARLGAQGESIGDAEKNLDLATIEGRIADEKARELKTLNGSMFAVHVANPFTASRRRRDRDEKVLRQHQDDRQTRDDTRAAAHDSNQRMDRTFRNIERDAAKQSKGKKASVTERAKYQFEADSDDVRIEDEIEQNLDLLGGAASRLNGLAKATGKELDEHNKHLDRITGKVSFFSFFFCDSICMVKMC